jgi:hypothetical protein
VSTAFIIVKWLQLHRKFFVFFLAFSFSFLVLNSLLFEQFFLLIAALLTIRSHGGICAFCCHASGLLILLTNKSSPLTRQVC